MLRVALGLWLLWLCLEHEARADIYEFVDRDGVAHYTNIAPKGRGWKKILKTRKSRPKIATRAFRQSAYLSDQKRTSRYDVYIEEAALLYQLPPSFIRAVLQVESNFYPDVISVDGAMGLMQLMPATAASMGVRNPFDPRENIFGGTRFLRVLANYFNGDLILTIAAYNAGQAAVLKYQGVPPYPETRRYVQNVLRHYYSYRMANGR
ncbi:MAG: lytic transglycosylase domain-containing protein [Deltaproteobacteria bacterium]|nr:lytic transglycosylase domain-containing protein [Deltaproteobacteria bacterium]